MSAEFNFHSGEIQYSYATYSDCKLFEIKPIPWLWGENWVIDKIDQSCKKIGCLVNKQEGSFLEIYKQMQQPHFFLNILYNAQPFPWHSLVEVIPLDEIENCSHQLDQVISWDSLHFLTKTERMDSLTKISKLMNPEKSIMVFSFLHRLNMSDEAHAFFSSERYKKTNHQYHSSVNIKEMISLFSNNDYDISCKEALCAYGFKNYNEKYLIDNVNIITSKQFDVIDIDYFKDIPEIIPVIENVYISYAGISLKFDCQYE